MLNNPKLYLNTTKALPQKHSAGLVIVILLVLKTSFFNALRQHIQNSYRVIPTQAAIGNRFTVF
jgi:hypothetical protein